MPAVFQCAVNGDEGYVDIAFDVFDVFIKCQTRIEEYAEIFIGFVSIFHGYVWEWDNGGWVCII